MGHNGFSVEKNYIRRAVSNKRKLCRIAAPEIAFLQFFGAAFCFLAILRDFWPAADFLPIIKQMGKSSSLNEGGKRYEETI